MLSMFIRQLSLGLSISLAGISCGFLAGNLPSMTSPLDGVKDISLPPGFSIEVYVDDIDGARSMTRGPGGVLFVGSRNTGIVYAVKSTAGGSKEVLTIASGLNSPNGVAFRDGSLYVAEISRVIRFDNIESSLHTPPEPVVVNDSFPADRHHGWKFIRFGPDGKLYVPVGAPCNTCERDDPRYASIMRMNPDGTELELFASGVRNTVGFDWDPADDVLWFTDNGRDNLGDDIPPDELNAAPRKGMHFGFPYLFGRNVRDPAYAPVADVLRYTPPEAEFGAHVAALGMRFYTGTMFPERYRNGIFVAEHGSWNRSVPDGYRVTFIPVTNGKAGKPEVFAEGWLDGSTAWGRPVDVEVLPDGSLLISDDKGDAIYRVTYREEEAVRSRQ